MTFCAHWRDVPAADWRKVAGDSALQRPQARPMLQKDDPLPGT
jgi:hypothetical protein